MQLFFKMWSWLQTKFFVPRKHDVLPHLHHKNLDTDELPDARTLEETISILSKVRVVFDFSPTIPLVLDMKILNKGLTYLYHNPVTKSEEKNEVTTEVIKTVQRFSHILPDIDLLLHQIENVHQEAEKEKLKQQIMFSLEKVSYDENSLSCSPKYNNPPLEYKINRINNDDKKK